MLAHIFVEGRLGIKGRSRGILLFRIALKSNSPLSGTAAVNEEGGKGIKRPAIAPAYPGELFADSVLVYAVRCRDSCKFKNNSMARLKASGASR